MFLTLNGANPVNYERIMPLDIIPTLLLRDLLIRAIAMAQLA